MPSTTDSHLIQWLDTRPTGDLRFVCNANIWTYCHMYGYIDFNKNVLGVGGDDWMSPGSITLTCVPGMMLSVPMDAAKKATILRMIDELPARRMWFLEPYDFNRNIYFSTRNSSSIYVYPKSHLPNEVISLMRFFDPSVLDTITRTKAP